MIKARCLLTFVFLTFYLSIFSQNLKIDSLKNEIDHSRGKEKLALMVELSNLYVTREKKIETSDALREEAIKQKNMKYVASSYTLKASAFIGSTQIDSVIHYANLANDIYKKYNLENPKESYKLIAKAYIYNGYYELGLYNVKRYMEGAKSLDAYMLLTEIYYMTDRYDLAKEIAIKAINDLPTYKEQTIPYAEYLLYDVLALSYIKTNEYEEALKICSKMQQALGPNVLKNKIALFYQFHLYVRYACIYVRKNDAINAKKYLDKLDQMPLNEYRSIIEAETNGIMCEYYLLFKDYNKALYYINKALDSFKNRLPLYYMYVEAADLKVKVLEGLNRYEDALSLQKEISNSKDSIYRINMPLQMLKLSKSYEDEKSRIEQEKSNAQLIKSKILNITLIIIAILLILITYIVFRNSKKLKEKNQLLVKKYAEVDKYIDVIKMNFPENQDRTTCDTLFEEIESYMTDRSAYINPDLTREYIAKELNTNRRYITEAIKEATGHTFSDYVNFYRLDHARKQLLADETTSVNVIVYDSGFSSISTFYRLFKNEYGMTPNEFRKAQKKMKSKIIGLKK
ncbi:AraC family transcriptional regulator [Dysgonomonas sp. Marseille-P4677]|uniref:helix-turn-helix domain-containing protein n=1 Tax=Dysgonomonas sp. Marseille-P4677 TaxID=2364790 RepID=UPI001913493F|nr:helix-turn-helix domain-containing protein [Dysgonomonas sp. Marseille-P4677]MBK5722285.1 AraC family transcriptional regulator [Dysgonomonas sp. Marseille-P4677]